MCTEFDWKNRVLNMIDFADKNMLDFFHTILIVIASNASFVWLIYIYIYIYRLVVINHDFNAFLKKSYFLAGKWAWPPHNNDAEGFWNLKTRLKSGPTEWTSWVNHYLKNMFS